MGTHTLAHMEVSATAFDEIQQKLEAAGYDHAILVERDEPTMLDMSGIGLVRAEGNVIDASAAMTATDHVKKQL